jgi:hypothetical protein
MSVKSYNSGLEEELRAPKNLSLKGKIIWYQNKYREAILNNSFSEAKKENYKKYARELEESVDYLLGLKDYRNLSNEARRIVMYLLSVNKAWTFTPELVKKKPEEVLKFMDADLLPDFRKKIIINFLNGQIPRRPLKSWEKKILEDAELNDTQCMYRTGRRYSEVVFFRKKL